MLLLLIQLLFFFQLLIIELYLLVDFMHFSNLCLEPVFTLLNLGFRFLLDLFFSLLKGLLHLILQLLDLMLVFSLHESSILTLILQLQFPTLLLLDVHFLKLLVVLLVSALSSLLLREQLVSQIVDTHLQFVFFPFHRSQLYLKLLFLIGDQLILRLHFPKLLHDLLLLPYQPLVILIRSLQLSHLSLQLVPLVLRMFPLLRQHMYIRLHLYRVFSQLLNFIILLIILHLQLIDEPLALPQLLLQLLLLRPLLLDLRVQ